MYYDDTVVFVSHAADTTRMTTIHLNVFYSMNTFRMIHTSITPRSLKYPEKILNYNTWSNRNTFIASQTSTTHSAVQVPKVDNICSMHSGKPPKSQFACCRDCVGAFRVACILRQLCYLIWLFSLIVSTHNQARTHSYIHLSWICIERRARLALL